MITRPTTPLSAALAAAVLFAGCARRDFEYVEALPDRETVTVGLPEGTRGQGLAPAIEAEQPDGDPSDLYTSTYYTARDLNGIVTFVIDLLEEITSYPATTITEDSATWGPFSGDQEPNEWRLDISRSTEGTEHYTWSIAGRHVSETGDFTTIASGAFEPKAEDSGRGWFLIDFDAIHTLNPAESGRGVISFAFSRGEDGTRVAARYDGPGDGLTGRDLAARYVYGKTPGGDGFVIFSFPSDVDEGRDGRTGIEDVLIHTRWTAARGGRADVLATGGDLAPGAARGSQCWSERFVTTYEHIEVDGGDKTESGDPSSCVFEEADLPDPSELPDPTDTMSPYAAEHG